MVTVSNDTVTASKMEVLASFANEIDAPLAALGTELNTPGVRVEARLEGNETTCSESVQHFRCSEQHFGY